MFASFINTHQYGTYFAVLLACVISMFDRVDEFHNAPFVMSLFLLACSTTIIYKENPGIATLMYAFFLQGLSTYLLKHAK